MKLNCALLALLVLNGSLVACGGADADPAVSDSEDELRGGEAVLRVPLLDRDGKLLKTHNDALEGKGIAPIREATLEFRASRMAAAQAKWDAIGGRIDEAQEKDLDIEMLRYSEPYAFVTDDANTMCWKGNALKVIDMISSMGDGIFSDQLSIHGWRYKSRKWSYAEEQGGEPEDVDAEFPRIWREWRGNGEAILMITASSDGGEEMNVALIPKCR